VASSYLLWGFMFDDFVLSARICGVSSFDFFFFLTFEKLKPVERDKKHNASRKNKRRTIQDKIY